MYIADSNLIIAKFRQNEEKHESSKQFIAQLETFVITDYILAEVATVLQLRSGKAMALEAIDFLISTKGIIHTHLTQEELEMTLDLFMKQGRRHFLCRCQHSHTLQGKEIQHGDLRQRLSRVGKKATLNTKKPHLRRVLARQSLGGKTIL